MEKRLPGKWQDNDRKWQDNDRCACSLNLRLNCNDLDDNCMQPKLAIGSYGECQFVVFEGSHAGHFGHHSDVSQTNGTR